MTHETFGEIPDDAMVTRHPLEMEGTTYIFQVNFPVDASPSDGALERLLANQARVYEALAAQGYGAIVDSPGISNAGALLPGIKPFYRRGDLTSDHVDRLSSQLADMHPHAFRGWDGEEPVPDMLHLLTSQEVDSLVMNAMQQIVGNQN